MTACKCESHALLLDSKGYSESASAVLKAHSENRAHVTKGTGEMMPKEEEGEE